MSDKIDNSYYMENNISNTEYNNVNNKCYYICFKCDDGPIFNNKLGDLISQNCIECISNYYLKEGTKNCYNNDTIGEGYYLDINHIPHTWKKCYEKCGSCYKSGNSTNMNCISCNKNYINNKTSEPHHFQLTENGNCIESCSDNLFLTSRGECVPDCPNGTFKFSFNNKCIQKCPSNYELNKEQNKCILKSINQNTSLYEFKSIINNNITPFVNSSSLINGSDFIAIISTSDDMNPNTQLEKGISAIDLGNYTQDIKNYYNIPKDENLIILNMELKRNKIKDKEINDDKSLDLDKTFQIEIYDKSGRKLNLSVCKENIKVMKYIRDVEELDLLSAINFAEKGVDVFNASDEFFNDICSNNNSIIMEKI